MTIPSRDRLRRPVDISTLFRGAARRVDLIVDQPGLIWNGLSGGDRPPNALRAGRSSSGTAGGLREAHRSGAGSTSRGFHEAESHRSGPTAGRALIGLDTSAATSTGGQPRRINLPSWYRRRPLQDITALVEALDRRRAELRQVRQAQEAENDEVQQTEIAEVQQTENVVDQQTENAETLEVGSLTPLPTIFSKAHPSTPQRRLLDSIDKVREIWLEDQKRIRRTPAAKKAERERRVRTLMSIR